MSGQACAHPSILVTDDSSVMRKMLRKALELGRFEHRALLEAANGRDALEILRRETVDLLLMDVNMPVMGGMELLEEIRRDENLRALPVVVVSTEGSETRLERFVELGASFVRKPFTPESVVGAARKALEATAHG